MDRCISDACPYSGNIQIGSYYRRGIDDWNFKKYGSGIYLFLAIPAMFGASLLKLVNFGLSFTAKEAGMLALGCLVSFGLSVVAIKFLMGYIKQHDFKIFGYYRIALGAIIIIVSLVQLIIA